MRRDEALAIPAAHKEELPARYHVRSLALFDLVARDEAGPPSVAASATSVRGAARIPRRRPLAQGFPRRRGAPRAPARWLRSG